jgi:hypothetical protein
MVRLFAEVFIEAFAKLQATSPQSRLDRGVTHVKHLGGLIYGEPFNVPQYEDRPQDQGQFF